MGRSGVVALVSNTSWYLYNFRRGTLAALRDAGYRVVCLAPPDAYSRRLEEELGAEHLPLAMEGKSTRLWDEARSLLTLANTLRRLRPAFVFNYTVKANIYSGLACQALRIPYANNVSGLGTAFIHDGWLFRRVRSLYGLANRGARQVFLQNPDDHALLQSHGLLRNSPTMVLPGSGIDTARFDFSHLPDASPFTFVMIARLLGDKGVREYVQAAELVREQHPDTRFLLVGPHGASNRTAIPEEEVRAWQARGVVEYLGEQEDVRPFIRQSHILVLPSYREGMPRTVLEAAAMGRPAIVSDVPGCRHAVVDGETGWLAPVKRPEALARQMVDCAALPREALAQAGSTARQRIERVFDERVVVAATLACLRDEPVGASGSQ
ncbi:glycosyltransferase family 4 protein [Alkalilimnicola ehrlichii MLHE-1]|uniref:Glycosyl transferase, group 1 n=1 Tax=Alkalilimnicola ehrlichii (strain ATCC BAA-1101 / DSM 17681 / MLHE-1) TaxID=187272 RepID=Q0A656_ALKEH|nr:glycosyltransferase family 4 protein [Alkalilimnicola ehrlichii]ABI57681.1 glycosyl transferase, group 1 [Alkalilimnicola ehrlichii MLHE-1]